jgi:hypothetical protein
LVTLVPLVVPAGKASSTRLCFAKTSSPIGTGHVIPLFHLRRFKCRGSTLDSTGFVGQYTSILAGIYYYSKALVIIGGRGGVPDG